MPPAMIRKELATILQLALRQSPSPVFTVHVRDTGPLTITVDHIIDDAIVGKRHGMDKTIVIPFNAVNFLEFGDA